MKIIANLSLVAAVLLSSAAFAAGSEQVLAKYSFTASRALNTATVADVTLEADGALVVATSILTAGQASVPHAPNAQVQTLQLQPATLDMLKQKVIQLAEAQVSTTHSVVVCMMMPLFASGSNLSLARDYDFNTESFTGKLLLVDNHAGCWQGTHIGFASDYDRTTARELESALQVLTTEALSN